MSKHGVVVSLAAAISMTVAGWANAAVSPEEAERLGQDLTCVGAERAGNADGSIPEFKGLYVGKVPGWDAAPHSGAHPIDPFAADQPILVITAANMAEHADKLTDGQQAMLKRYPDTYKINVYEGRREFAYPEVVCERAKWNALNAEVVDDGFGYTGLGYVPFPIPKSAMEVLWNHQLPFRAWTQDEIRDIASVTASGSIGWGRSHGRCLAPPMDPDPNLRPHTDDGVSAYCTTEVLLPLRERGNTSLNHEPYNYRTAARTAWSYNTGTRRVRLAPGYGYDQPLGGSNGLMTIDEDRLFNGAPDRYDWTLVGKQEVIIPANAYKVHGKDVSYKDLLTANHPNPEYLRYELRRVWVIEANVKPGSRHLYGKRRLFIDEDNWHAVMADNYDSRGDLWKHAIINYYYHPDTSAWQAGTSFFHDLNSGGYIGYTLANERERAAILNKGEMDPSQFTPDRLRAMGR
ncbi:DUF1329 domain-containing protein [Halopseudomonas xiamenensis]|uniref:DUF1329 domain-containing protein n=1 Tax=Halopseudomonas xiamenensis TaxID=157792 RepID=UPI00162A3416|nr:DUF1329 domain-containing protein [Halopseudomonas xiamenensis]